MVSILTYVSQDWMSWQNIWMQRNIIQCYVVMLLLVGIIMYIIVPLPSTSTMRLILPNYLTYSVNVGEFVYYFYTDNTVNFCNSIFFQTQMAHLHLHLLKCNNHIVCKFCSDYFLYMSISQYILTKTMIEEWILFLIYAQL